MKITPLITEKSTELAKSGKYTFKVDKNLSKGKIKHLIGKLFDVDVIGIRTIKIAGEIKRSFQRRKKVLKPAKKAIVWLKEKQKIDLFETKKK